MLAGDWLSERSLNLMRCFHRNRGYRRRCRRHHQTVVPSHLPTGCGTLPSGLQVRHARRQAAAAVKTFSAVKSFLLSRDRFSLKILFSLEFTDLSGPWAFKAPTGIKRTHSSAQTALPTEATAFVCIYWNVYICPSGKVIGCNFRLVSYTVYRTFLL